MPSISQMFDPARPSPLLFVTCGHFSPPTPFPGVKPTAGTRSTSPNYSFRCLSCDISHRCTQQDLALDTYNGLIQDQGGRLLIAAERKGTEREGRYDAEMVAEGERRIKNWTMKRALEVDGIWKGFLDRWDGGHWYGGANKRNLNLKLKVNRDGGFCVDGLPGDLGV